MHYLIVGKIIRSCLLAYYLRASTPILVVVIMLLFNDIIVTMTLFFYMSASMRTKLSPHLATSSACKRKFSNMNIKITLDSSQALIGTGIDSSYPSVKRKGTLDQENKYSIGNCIERLSIPTAAAYT